MPYRPVHAVQTSPEWWEIGGYHPHEMRVEIFAWGRERILGVLKDGGAKPEGTLRKTPRPFSVSYNANANLAEVARFLEQKLLAGEDIRYLRFN